MARPLSLAAALALALAVATKGEEASEHSAKGVLQGSPLPERGLKEVESDFDRWQKQLESGGPPSEDGELHGAASTEALLNYSRNMRAQLESMGAHLETDGGDETEVSGRKPRIPSSNSNSSDVADEPEDNDHATMLGLPCSDMAALGLMGEGSAGLSPASIYATSFGGWLRKNPYQVFIAVFAIVVGFLCAWDGPGVWRALFTTAAAAAAAGLARFELEALNLAPGQTSEAVLMAQAAAAVALATHSGFEGSQVLLGFAVGSAGAYTCGETVRQWDAHIPGIALLWYTSGAALGLLIYTVWRRHVFAALGPLFGGLLVSSGSGVLLGRAFEALGGARPAILPPPSAPWFSAAAALAGGQDFLAGHCACALLSLVVHGCSEERRMPAVCILVGCVALTGLAAVSSFECRRHVEEKDSCPSWLEPAGGMQWQWPVFGSVLWAVLTAAAAWRQLGIIQVREVGGPGGARGFFTAYWTAALGCEDSQVSRKSRLLREERAPEEESQVFHQFPTGATAAPAAAPLVVMPAALAPGSGPPVGTTVAGPYTALRTTSPESAGPSRAASRSNAASPSNAATGAADTPSLLLWLTSAQRPHAPASPPFAPPGSGV